MTIAAQTPIVTLPGNGVITAFNYNFEVPYQSDGSTPAVLVQTWDGNVLHSPVTIDPSLYSINGVGVQSGGTVTYPLSGSPVAVGAYLIIKRNLAYSQAAAFPNTSFQPEQIEAALDQVEMQIQQLAAGVTAGSSGGGGAGVATFNGRDGTVTLFGSDVTGAIGYTPVDKAGDTMGGRLVTSPSNGSRAGLNVAPGTDPSGPQNGDVWITNTAMKARVGGTDYTIAPTVAAFDQTTPYAVGALADADLNLLQRGSVLRTLFDYGALGDGTTDDTAAWNKMVADANAGVIKSIFIPGFNFYIPGDTDAFTRGIDILGTGDNSLLTFAGGGGTSICINFSNIDNADRVSMLNFKLHCNAPILRQAIQVSWATESLLFSIQNVSMDGAFLRGIGLDNCVVGHFDNVTINMYNPVTHEWGWNLTSANGHYNVDVRWVECTVSAATYGWKGNCHMQGLVWEACEAGFCNYGIYMVATTATNPPLGLPAPEVIIHGCAMECVHYCVYLFGFVDIMVSNNWTTNDAGTAGDSTFVFENCYNITVHDNTFAGPATNWNGVEFRGTCDTALVHHNMFRLLAGAGVYCTGTSAHIVAEDNNFFGPRAGSYPFSDATTSNNNIHRGTTSDSALIQYSGVSQDGSLVTTTAISGAAFTRVAATDLAGMSVRIGEQFRIQACVIVNTPSANLTATLHIREYNHRPGSANPFPVFYVNFNRTLIQDTRYVPQTTTTGKSAIFTIDTVVRIIGSADDALFVLEMATDDAAVTANVVERGFWVGRQ